MKLSLFVSAVLAAVSGFGTPDEKRIFEISRMLPAKAGMVGFRPEDRQRWAELAREKKGKELIKRAEAVLAYPVPETSAELYYDCRRTGNRSSYEKPSGEKIWNLKALMFGEALEQKGRFLPAIVKYIEDILAERSWVLPAHDLKLRAWRGELYFIDLGCAGRMFTLSVAYALFRDRLPAGLPKRIVSEIRRRGLDNYLIVAANPNKRKEYAMDWFYGPANWNAVCNSRVVRAALNIFDDPLVRARFVEAAERTVEYFLKGFSSDGYCSEGMGYWKYGFGHHLYMGLAVRAATGGKVDLFKNPVNRKIMLYGYGARMSRNRGLPFSDGAKGGKVDAELFALGRQIWPDLVNSEAMDVPFFDMDFNQFALRAFGQEPARVKPVLDVLPLQTFFPEAQVFVMRAPGEGRASPPFAFAIKGGHNNEFHNHNDVGSTAIFLGDEQLAGDPGGCVYTRFTFSPKTRYDSPILNSYGHPVPVVDGRLQSQGESSAAKVLKVDSGEDGDTVVLDLTAVYPGAKHLKSLVRTAFFNRSELEVTVTDKVVFTEPSAFETPIVTFCDVVADYSQSRLTLRGRRGKVGVNVSAGKDIRWQWKTELIPNPTLVAPKRLAVALKDKVLEAEIAITYKVLK